MVHAEAEPYQAFFPTNSAEEPIMPTVRIFVSAVRSEFESVVLELTKLLQEDQYEVVNQFVLDIRVEKTLQKLSDAIAGCDLVVHLIGEQLGSEPVDIEITDFLSGQPEFLGLNKNPLMRRKFQDRKNKPFGQRWSYTQWEAYIAIHQKKNILCFSPKPTAIPSVACTQPYHLDALKGECYANPFTFVTEIRSAVKLNTTERSGRFTTDPFGRLLGSAIPLGPYPYQAKNEADYRLISPGPYDANGIPQSIREWCRRVEERTFTIGTIHGPSGSGKSSWVRAGFIPQLMGKDIEPVFVQASRKRTERDVHDAIVHHFPDILNPITPNDQSSLPAIVDVIQSNQRQCLLIVDQFEQWLEENPDGVGTPFHDLLRKCSSDYFQVILLYRSEWQHKIKRFLATLDFEARSDTNDFMIDTFSNEHAQKVLTYFGRNLERFVHGNPFGDNGKPCNDHGEFIEQAVHELEDKASRVLAVHLSIFAWMVREKNWSPTTLEALRESGGPGVVYLRSFFENTAPQHLRGATQILEQLLPPKFSKNKIQKSRDDLVKSVRPRDYNISEYELSEDPNALSVYITELFEILENQLRVISRPESHRNRAGDLNEYQVSHDYMVVSVRKWFAGMQSTNDELGARSLLEERMLQYRHAANQVNALPTYREWRFILENREQQLLSRREKSFMQEAGRHHGKQIAKELLKKPIDQLPDQLEEIENVRDEFGDAMRQVLQKKSGADNIDASSRTKAIISLRLYERDSDANPFLYKQFLQCLSVEIESIAKAIETPIDSDKLNSILHKEGKEFEAQRIRAAAALAIHEPDKFELVQLVKIVIKDLVQVSPSELPLWLRLFSNISEKLVKFGTEYYADKKNSQSTRLIAIDVLGNFLKEDAPALAELLMDTEPDHVDIVLRAIELHGHENVVTQVLLNWFETNKWNVEGTQNDQMASRLANAILALLRFDGIHDKSNCEKNFLSRIKESHFSVRCYIVDRVWYFGVEVERLYQIVRQSDSEDIQSVLIACLGNHENASSTKLAKELLEMVNGILFSTSDSHLHATAEWLLRKWKGSDAALEVLTRHATKDRATWSRNFHAKYGHSPEWYINSNGHKMLIVPANQTFTMGSPKNESGRGKEDRHPVVIPRSFTMSAHHVTWQQFRAFCNDTRLQELLTKEAKSKMEEYKAENHHPVHFASWHMAGLYCNWLSEQENLVPVYLTMNGKPAKLKPKAKGITPIARILGDDFEGEPGYRLPTEAETEFCTRAGSTSAYFYGNDVELLTRFGWYALNGKGNSHPVGEKMPNALGFFDVIGNCYTWCQDVFRDYVADTEYIDRLTTTYVDKTGARVARGGAAHFDQASDVRSAYRYNKPANEQTYFFSFRIARTMR